MPEPINLARSMVRQVRVRTPVGTFTALDSTQPAQAEDASGGVMGWLVRKIAKFAVDVDTAGGTMTVDGPYGPPTTDLRPALALSAVAIGAAGIGGLVLIGRWLERRGGGGKRKR